MFNGHWSPLSSERENAGNTIQRIRKVKEIASLLTLILLQTCMTYFLPWSKKGEVRQNVHDAFESGCNQELLNSKRKIITKKICIDYFYGPFIVLFYHDKR